MTNFSIAIEQLQQGPVDWTLDAAPVELDLSDPEFSFPGRVKGRIEFKLYGHEVVGEGELSVAARSTCVRCLQPTDLVVRVSVRETWLHQDDAHPEVDLDSDPSIDAPLFRLYSGDEIDMREVIRELLSAELPERTYCSVTCKGLCSGCGADLNHDPCRCTPEVREQREAEKLPNWKNELKQLKFKS